MTKTHDKILTFDEYDDMAGVTAAYPNVGNNPIYPTLGLSGEAGEVAEKVKKMIRDDGGVLTDKRREAIIKELGDCLWYLSALARELNSSLEQVAATNILKLHDRYKRNKIQGEGDNR